MGPHTFYFFSVPGGLTEHFPDLKLIHENGNYDSSLYLKSLAFTFICKMIHFATGRWSATSGLSGNKPTTEATH